MEAFKVQTEPQEPVSGCCHALTAVSLACRSPIDINTPSGAVVPVNLELQMSSFSGYENEETSTYLGTQCHGVMWPETASLPAAWPICPPIVSGKASCTAYSSTSAVLSLKPSAAWAAC